VKAWLPDAVSILPAEVLTRDFASEKGSEQNLPERRRDRSGEKPKIAAARPFGGRHGWA
jgi:hypothetical protein